MSVVDEDCDIGYANYYSNPDVIHLGKPTGTETENCARGIKDNMVSPAKCGRSSGHYAWLTSELGPTMHIR